ncbi:MAG: DUF5916 domain-containing protein [Polaribacter sp.]|nr:DUF5916 domain-containing protein [Polaribacter sp.]MDG1811202.1 DUF5916 domain-containing protein [Polaribacter sp.]
MLNKKLLLLAFCFVQTISSQETSTLEVPKRIYTTKMVEKAPIIDGDITDKTWSVVDWHANFTQLSPIEGDKPTQKTKFKIIYDEKHLYLAVRCFDSEPDKIVKRLSRRDGNDGDWIEINLDSYRDLRTAFAFTVTAAGVKGEEFASLNGKSWDKSWNPIWFVKTKIDAQGWTAEFKIPLSQIRFTDKEEQIWGMQIQRMDFRLQERTLWQRKPVNVSGWISNMGELHGIKNIKPQKQLEIQPYTVAQTETFEREVGNPFATGKRSDINFGIDGKIGVTNNLTLDFTVNPDFGQVEADPSAIALDGFQIFQEEQRPFFVENKNIFDYQVTKAQAGGPFTRDNVFYSRRIGRNPEGSTTANSNEFVSRPGFSTILGASKFSGKTESGLSIGVLEAITQEEFAEIDTRGKRRKEVIEPLTNFFLTRLQKEYNHSNTLIGGIFTATNRNLTDTNITDMHNAAYSGGIDFKHQWKNRTWYVEGNMVVSKVLGNKEAIYNTQTSLRHNFQRVDATHVNVDSTRTSLTGTGGNIKVGKTSGGNFEFDTGVTWRSPELEMNDMGFQRNADDITHYNWMAYKSLQPFSVFRRLQVNYNHYVSWNFEGKHTYFGANTNSNATFQNNWKTGFNVHYAAINYSDSDLRGGPMLRLPSSIDYNMYVQSDDRKKVHFRISGGQDVGEDNSFTKKYASLRMTFVPLNSFNISLSANIDANNQELQYVTTKNYGIGNNSIPKYINANLDQDTFNLSLRLNYTITPNMSIQYYGSPFISRGRYNNFKYITNSLADKFTDRFQNYNSNQISYDARTDLYLVDENLDTTTDYSIENPDFSVIQFQSNLVARWEYIPGSEVFLVWSQGLNRNGNPMNDLLPSLKDNIFGQTSRNIFLIKATYRFML